MMFQRFSFFLCIWGCLLEQFWMLKGLRTEALKFWESIKSVQQWKLFLKTSSRACRPCQVLKTAISFDWIRKRTTIPPKKYIKWVGFEPKFSIFWRVLDRNLTNFEWFLGSNLTHLLIIFCGANSCPIS